MAFANSGTMGTGANSTSNSTYNLTTATTNLAVGNLGVLINVTDNTSTSDGNNNEHTSVTDSVGNSWVKVAERTNSPTAAAADGVTISIWITKCSVALNTGGTITMNFTSNRTDKASIAWAFTMTAGQAAVEGAADQLGEVNGANNFASLTFSGLASAARLYLRGCSKEANIGTTGFANTTNFTSMGQIRSRNNAAAVGACGEFRINTSTGETSNPTLAISGDTSDIFLALIEQDGAETLSSHVLS